MNIAVVILNWNQAADTLACVRMLRAFPLEPHQIWVVDNASRADERAQLAQAQQDAQVIYSDVNLGFAGGNNLALQQVLQGSVEAVLLLNNDAIVEYSAVESMLEPIQTLPMEYATVGPQIYDADAPDRLLSAGGLDIGLYASTHQQHPVPADEFSETNYVPGTCALIGTRALREVGLLDEQYFFGGEMAAWCYTAGQHGYYSLIDGSARALHSVRRSSKIRQSLHAYYVIRNRFLFVRQFHPDQQLKLFLKWTLTGCMMAAQARLQRNMPRARALWLGVLDGWQGRYGGQNARVTRGAVQ